MNTERTEKFVNAIACDLEEGGFRQVSGTMLRRTLATAVSAALPLLPPAELAEQRGGDAHTLWAMAQLAPGEGIEDGVQRIEKALAATGKQQVGESCTHEWRTAGGGSQARRPLVCSKCNQHRDHMPQQVGEVQRDGLASAARAGLPFIAYAFAQGVDGAEEAGRAIESALAARQPVVQEPVCSGGFVIGNGSGEKYMAWGQVGPEWVADRSAALWLVRRADAEALAAENEDAWLILPVERCALPPNGWACTLASGHEGPCPTIAAPPAQGIDLGQFRDAIEFFLRYGLGAQEEGERLLGLIDGQRDAAPGVDRSQPSAPATSLPA